MKKYVAKVAIQGQVWELYTGFMKDLPAENYRLVCELAQSAPDEGAWVKIPARDPHPVYYPARNIDCAWVEEVPSE